MNPTLRTLSGSALGLGTVGYALFAVVERSMDPQLAALLGFMWAVWIITNDVKRNVVDPVARWFHGQAVGGVADGIPLITMDEETRYLEHLVASPSPDRHHEIMAGIRLAEIYRTAQHDQAKSDALLARLREKYPDAPELRV